MKRTIKTLALAGVVLAAAGAGVMYSGIINVAADDPHFSAVEQLLQITRERSIAARTADIAIPALDDQALIRIGAGNYHAMCIGCHLAPGMSDTELSASLYPAPRRLHRFGTGGDPARAFWIIKHGIKASGMPAWGKSMGDPYIWGMVAFLQRLPQLDATQYRELVAQSEGHQHGGGESDMHDHSSQHSSHDAPAESAHDEPATTVQRNVHQHADGSQHLH
ncbi:cytochrome c family protein [Stutzerimonas stutzeri TS44]|nr:cytochrome c family protein [Stutzerimonas stutzeri TS44]